MNRNSLAKQGGLENSGTVVVPNRVQQIGEKMAVNNKEKIREIYGILPKLNCGSCGFGTCGQFARAVAEGRASPFGCRRNPWSVYRISEIIGAKVPAYGYGFQLASVLAPGETRWPETLKDLAKDVKDLSRNVDDVLARIGNLETKS